MTVDELSKQVADVQNAVTRTETLLKAHLDRTADEREALFTSRGEHERRIAGIERDYVPESRYRQDTKAQCERLDQNEQAIGEVKQSLAKATGVAIVVSTLLGYAVQLLGRMI